MELWQAILVAFGGNAVLLLVLATLSKALLGQWLKRDAAQFESELRSKADAAVEMLRASLKAETDAAIARLNADLQLAATEHQIRFARLHEKRAEIVAELYGYLVEALWEAESFLSPAEWPGEPKKKEKYVLANNAMVALYRYFDKHRVYLPDSIGTALDKLISDVRSHVINFSVFLRYDDQSMSAETHEKKFKAWNDGYDAIKKDVPQARKALEDAFRSLLGDR